MERKEQDEEISRLYRIIENELQKPEDEMDSSLIAECSDFIDELRQEQGDIPSPDYDRKLELIYAALEGGDEEKLDQAPQMAKRLRLPRRKCVFIRLAAALVAILVLTMSLTVVAVRNGYSSAWAYVVENIKDIMNMSGGDTDENGGITIEIHNSSTQYSTIEELLEKEQLDMMFPSVLPEGVILQRVVQHDLEANVKMWDFQTNTDRFSIVVYDYYRAPLEKLESMIEYQTERLYFVIVQKEDHTYQAIAQQDGYEYVIRYEDYDGLIKILTGMKGIDK